MIDISTALRRFPLTDERPWLVVIDLNWLRQRFRRLKNAFGTDWLHAVAIKAHPLLDSLATLVAEGAGLEAASAGELDLALDAGCPPHRLVFDSPVKTRAELRRAVDLGCFINADNLEEVQRIADLSPSPGRIGLRVNPEVAAGSVEALSVGTRNSKFGVSLTRQRDDVRGAFAQHEWLDGVHVHVGSHGCGVDLLCAGVRRAVDLAVEVGAARVDIGGGLPSEDNLLATYAHTLRQNIPELFDGSLTVVTEFGRWLFTGCAAAVSRVEYVKPAADVQIATIHFGADLLLRNAYQPGVWHYPIEVLTEGGEPKSAAVQRVTIGGPLCFAGDVVARDVELPEVAAGDVLAVHDIGAYTFAMWSTYCSRRPPTFVLIDHESSEEAIFLQTTAS